MQSSFMAPVYRKDIIQLERVHRRANKMMRGMMELSLKGKLKELNMLTSEQRYLPKDMISIYKILMEDCNVGIFFLKGRSYACNRRDEPRLVKGRFRLHYVQFFA